jgi:hypothetical protein
VQSIGPSEGLALSCHVDSEIPSSLVGDPLGYDKSS